MIEIADEELKKEFEDLIMNLGKDITNNSIIPTIKTEFKDTMKSHIDSITTLNNLNMVFIKNLNDYVKQENIIQRNSELTMHYSEFKSLITDFNSFYGGSLKETYDNLYKLDKYFAKIQDNIPDINKLGEDYLKESKKSQLNMLGEINSIKSKMDLAVNNVEYTYECISILESFIKDKMGQVSEDIKQFSYIQKIDYENINDVLRTIEEKNGNIEESLYNYDNKLHKKLDIVLGINMVVIASIFYFLLRLR